MDSFVESTSGGVMLWRLLAERPARNTEAVERLDRRAHQLIGLSLFLLSGFIAVDAVTTLRGSEEVKPSLVGILPRDVRELLGQLPRILLAGPGSLLGRAPMGNTGGTDMDIFTPMPIPQDLQALLRDA